MKVKINYQTVVLHIPFGEENAVKRRRLNDLIGLSDSHTRELVHQAKCKGECILNFQQGEGYFRPNCDDAEKVRHWIRQENHRIKEQRKAMKGAIDWIRRYG